MHTSLLVMAAGLGARYGGNKQIDKMGPSGEILMEYSIYDALEAGFDKIVFVIKRDMESVMREMIVNRISKKAEVAFAFQEYDSLPDGFQPPKERTKPYGTVHAVLCAKDVIAEPFAVINADDYYGKDAFCAMRESLLKMQQAGRASMVGYKLCNTVSEHGQVTRGVCSVDSQNKLYCVTETYKIALYPDGKILDMENHLELDPQSIVSMNFWGFTPWIFKQAEEYLADFLQKPHPDELKMECPLPVMIDNMMQAGSIQVDVLTTDACWFGVTVREDKPIVQDALLQLHKSGAYPKQLF